MHKYLRAIGFGKIKNRLQFDPILKKIMQDPDHKSLASTGLGSTSVQYDKKFGDYIGLSLVGEVDLTGEIFFEHSFPFLFPSPYRREEDSRIEKRCANEAYDGIMEDIGMSIVFYVQNITDYNRYYWYTKKNTIRGVHFSALSLGGKILLPLAATKESLEAYDKDIAESYELLEKAKKGDSFANDELIIKNIQDKNEADKRSLKEDVFTIVKSSLIPTGVECEEYELTGLIIRVGTDKNSYTGEEIYMLLVKCNELVINIAINKEDLVGTPEMGRRFRGVVWLQGYLSLPSKLTSQ